MVTITHSDVLDALDVDGVNPTDHIFDTLFADIRVADDWLNLEMWEDTAETVGDRACAYAHGLIDEEAAGTRTADYAKAYLGLVNWPRIGRYLLDNFIEWRAEEHYYSQHDGV